MPLISCRCLMIIVIAGRLRFGISGFVTATSANRYISWHYAPTCFLLLFMFEYVCRILFFALLTAIPGQWPNSGLQRLCAVPPPTHSKAS